MVHCCWRHNISTSWNMIQDEVLHSEYCTRFLEDVAFLQAIRCPNVRFNQLTPSNLPPLISANYNSDCELLSRNVKAVFIDNTAKCIWFPGHFDLGSRYSTSPYEGMTGMMPRKLCHKLHQDCKVNYFWGTCSTGAWYEMCLDILLDKLTLFLNLYDRWNNIPHYTQTKINGRGPCEPSLTSYYAHHS